MFRHISPPGAGTTTAYIDPRGTFRTYGQLAERVARFGHVLRSARMRPGERVLICLLDTIDWPTSSSARSRPACVAVPVNTLMTEDDYRFMLADSRRARAGGLGGALPKFAKLVAAIPESCIVVVSGGHKELPHQDLDKLIADVAPAERASPTTCDDICVLALHLGLDRQAEGARCMCMPTCKLTNDLYAAPIFGMTENDVCFSVAKLFFAYGLGNAMTFPLSAGATTVLLPDRPTPDGVADILRKHQVTVFYCGADLLCGVSGEPRRAGTRGTGAACCVSAGEALPPDVGRRWRKRYGVDILDGLGSTEMLHIFLSNRPGDVKYGTSGKPVPGYRHPPGR